MTQHYELLYIVPIKYLDDELQKVIANVNELVKTNNGQIVKEDNLGKQKLAYPIEKVHQGSYILVEFDMEGENYKELDNQLKLKPEVIRHLIIKKRVKTEEEIKREEKIAAGVRKSKEEELAEIEENEKVVIKKKLEAPVKEVKIEKADKADSKKTLEDLDKKLDEILTDDIL
jgi:small subunit ribosomal protein S6